MFTLVSFDGEYQPRQKSYDAFFFAIALNVSKILTFEMCDLENVSEDHRVPHHRVQHSQ